MAASQDEAPEKRKQELIRKMHDFTYLEYGWNSNLDYAAQWDEISSKIFLSTTCAWFEIEYLLRNDLNNFKMLFHYLDNALAHNFDHPINIWKQRMPREFQIRHTVPTWHRVISFSLDSWKTTFKESFSSMRKISFCAFELFSMKYPNRSWYWLIRLRSDHFVGSSKI